MEIENIAMSLWGNFFKLSVPQIRTFHMLWFTYWVTLMRTSVAHACYAMLRLPSELAGVIPSEVSECCPNRVFCLRQGTMKHYSCGVPKQKALESVEPAAVNCESFRNIRIVSLSEDSLTLMNEETNATFLLNRDEKEGMEIQE